VTCDEVRELLPEHLLGTLDGPEDLEVRRHLRGCAGCRTDMAALSEGVEWFARAAHDREPPPDLHDRVMTTLEQEWRDADGQRPDTRRSPWFARAAALVAIVAALTWGVSQTHRANLASADAESYRTVLATLGGKEFRVGQLDPQIAHPIQGSVVLYDSHQGQSWGIVLVRAPGLSGTAMVTLSIGEGTGAADATIDAGTLEFQPDGDAATWLVTSSDLTPYDHLTITADDGTVLATADIRPA
jgi:anti-sigma factor RsiW